MPILQGLIQLVGVNKSSLTLKPSHCNSLYIQAHSAFESMWLTCTDWSWWVSLLFLPDEAEPAASKASPGLKRELDFPFHWVE